MAVRRPLTLPPTVDAAVAAWCARRHAITQREARALGLTRAMQRSRLAAGRLYEVHPGVLALTPTLDDLGRCAAALLWAQGTLGHESVLHRHQLVAEPPLVHVILPFSRDEPDGVRVHRSRHLPDADVTTVDGLRATTVARAILDVAPRTSPRRLRALVHEAQYRKLLDALPLDDLLRTHPGHPGLGALRAVEPAPPGAESDLERRLHRALALVPGVPPVPQFWVTLPSGRRIRADAAFVEERVLVEADGRSAHARMLAFEEDRARDNETMVLGWLPLRYTAARLRRPRNVADEILRALVARGGSARGR